jgi:hypothetical protein
MDRNRCCDVGRNYHHRVRLRLRPRRGSSEQETEKQFSHTEPPERRIHPSPRFGANEYAR